jgi:tetratricopeptide (TPR) repeat protein
MTETIASGEATPAVSSNTNTSSNVSPAPSNDFIDYYEEFAINPNLSLEELRKELHKQRGRTSNMAKSEARVRVAIIDQALTRLSDETARIQYDAELASWKESQVPKETDWYAKANSYFYAEDYDLAIKAVQQAISQHPQDGQVYLLAARIYSDLYQQLSRGEVQPENAIEHEARIKSVLNQIIEYTSQAILFGEEENVEVYRIRAIAFYLLKQNEETKKNLLQIRKYYQIPQGLQFTYDANDPLNLSYRIESYLYVDTGNLQEAMKSALQIGNVTFAPPDIPGGKYECIDWIMNRAPLNQKILLVDNTDESDQSIVGYFGYYYFLKETFKNQPVLIEENLKNWRDLLDKMKEALKQHQDLPKNLLIGIENDLALISKSNINDLEKEMNTLKAKHQQLSNEIKTSVNSQNFMVIARIVLWLVIIIGLVVWFMNNHWPNNTDAEQQALMTGFVIFILGLISLIFLRPGGKIRALEHIIKTKQSERNSVASNIQNIENKINVLKVKVTTDGKPETP